MVLARNPAKAESRVFIAKYWRAWLTVAIVLAAAVSFHVRIGRRMPDFQVYRVAGGRALAGEQLYRQTDGHWQFKYLPAFAFVFSPVSLLPAPPDAQTTEPRGREYDPWSDTARVVWFACSVALLVLLVTLSLRLLPRDVGRPLRAAVTAGLKPRPARNGAIVGLTILAMGKFYAHELELGQTNILMALVVVLALAQWKNGRDAYAGALLAAATVVKPYAVLFVPYLVVRRQWRACAGFAVVLGAALLVPAMRYGMHQNAQLLAGWWATVTTSTPPNLAVSDNVSIAAMYAKWFGVGRVASSLAVATAGALLAACGWVLVRRPKTPFPQYLDAAVLLILIPLLSPQGWDYVLLVATPGVMLVVGNIDRFGKWTRWMALACLLVAGLTLWDVVGRRIYTLFMVSSIVTFCYLFTIVLLLRLRRTQVA